MGANEITLLGLAINIIITFIALIFTYQVKQKTIALDRIMELNNQVQFKIYQEEIIALSNVYDKYLDFYHSFGSLFISEKEEENFKVLESIRIAFDEFNKASFRLDLWFFDEKKLSENVNETLRKAQEIQKDVKRAFADFKKTPIELRAEFLTKSNSQFNIKHTELYNLSELLKSSLSTLMKKYKVRDKNAH